MDEPTDIERLVDGLATIGKALRLLKEQRNRGYELDEVQARVAARTRAGVRAADLAPLYAELLGMLAEEVVSLQAEVDELRGQRGRAR